MTHVLIGIAHAPSRMREVRAIKLIVCALTNIYSGIDGTVHIAFVIVLFLIVSRTHSYTRFLSNTKVQFLRSVCFKFIRLLRTLEIRAVVTKRMTPTLLNCRNTWKIAPKEPVL